MTATKDKVVTIHYRLTSDTGETIDSSEGSEPLAYLHGAGNIVPGLEQALEGRGEGDEIKVSVSPEEGYGEVKPGLRGKVSRQQFGEEAEELEVGMQFHARMPEGDVLFRIVEIEDDEVVIDGNHPLAGETLHFDVTVVEVRDATQQEIDHGHAHGAHGHDH